MIFDPATCTYKDWATIWQPQLVAALNRPLDNYDIGAFDAFRCFAERTPFDLAKQDHSAPTRTPPIDYKTYALVLVPQLKAARLSVGKNIGYGDGSMDIWRVFGSEGWPVDQLLLDIKNQPHDNPPFAPPIPVPQPRPPLPPFPACGSCPTPDSYDKTLLWTPPHTRDVMRAATWDAIVDGLPAVPGGPSGGSSEHPERLITGLDYKYDRKIWWPKMLAAQAVRGLTHWVRWMPDALYDIDFGGSNDLAKFVDDCLLVKSVIPYCVVSLGSKVYDPRDQSADDWKRRVGPAIDALLKANAVDEFIPAFEVDSFNVPGRPTIDYCKWVGQQAHAAGKSCWMHFLPEHTSWFADGDPRGRYGFWDDLGADVDGLLYQGDPEWIANPQQYGIGYLQAKIVDTLRQFNQQGNRHKLRAYELTAETSFTHDHPNEGEAALIAYLALCTNYPDTRVWGSGHPACQPDGTLI